MTAAERLRRPVDLETSLRRIVVGYRAVAAVWMTSLALIALNREEPGRPAVVVGAVALVIGWTAVTTVISFQRRAWLRSWWFLLADLGVTGATLQAPRFAEAANFYGGYPISSVVIGVYGLGMWGGVLAFAVLTGIAAWRAAIGDLTGDPTSITGAVVVYPFIAAPLIWAVGVLRRSDRLRREAEAELEEERARRIQAQERANVAAHLHDSVLQTLALIQRRSGNPEEVVSLARAQERDLRSWLFPRARVADSLEAALVAACSEVEETYHVPVDVVVVGAAELDADREALVAATREAVVNAAKHSGSPNVSVYAEAVGSSVTVFIRDRGIGFEPSSVDDDRKGIAESIVGRMQRHGGTARISSGDGGTEVELTMGS